MSGEEDNKEEAKKRSVELDVNEAEAKAKKPKLETEELKKPTVGEQKQEKEGGKEVSKETEGKKEKPKHVFGSTTGFGQMSGFSMFSSKDAFTWNDNKTEMTQAKEPSSSVTKSSNDDKEKANSTFTSKSVFGSGSSFGNAFQDAVKAKSIFDVLNKGEDKKDKSAAPSKEKSAKESDNKEEDKVELDVYKKVHLERQEVKSGEENETTLFQAKAKLYYMQLANASEGWKEKGLGVIKVNKYNESPSKLYTSRLLMRQDGNLKLILNLPLVEGFNIVKGMPSSLNADKFLRIQAVNGEEPIQYALKLQVDNVTGLYDSVQKQIPKKSSTDGATSE